MNKLITAINPQLELMNSILLTSKYNEITKPVIGYGLMSETESPYTTAIKERFCPYADHPVYMVIERMIPGGFTFSRPVELALSLDDGFKIVRPLSNICIEYCSGQSQIDELLTLVKDIATKINYNLLFREKRGFYTHFIEKINGQIENVPLVDTVEVFYGGRQRSYNLVLSSLMLGCFGFSFRGAAEGESDIFTVLSINNSHSDISILLHELSHPFINPLTEKYRSEVDKYSAAYEYLKQFKLPGFSSGYGDWEECVNEHLVRAATIHMLNKLALTKLADINLKNDLHSGYRFIPVLLEKIKIYEQSRTVYPTLEAYYPTLLRAFTLEVNTD